MSFEIRRVPPNWEPPKIACPHRPLCYGGECYQPMHNESYEKVARDYMENFILWSQGEHPDQLNPFYKNQTSPLPIYYWEWDGDPPNKEYYLPYKSEEATWYQAYETVSEGRPITPPFETQEQLVEYLVNHGDYWQQKRDTNPGYSREHAENFVYRDGYAPTFVMENGVLKRGIENCE